MPSYTLYYFNGRGRAEAIRMMFGVAGVQFNDKRIEFNEWDKYRNEMPCQAMPVLEVDGKNNRMPETMAICRYLAREFGFYGKSNMEMFRIDYISDCLYDLMHDYMRYFHAKNGRFMNNMSSNMGSNMSNMSNMGSNMSNMGNMGSNMGSNMGNNMSSMNNNMSSNRSNSMSSDTSSIMGSSSNRNMTSNMTGNMSSNMNSNMGSNMSGNMGSNMSGNMGSNMGGNMGSNMSGNMGSNMSGNMGSNMSGNMGSGMGSVVSYLQMRFMETSRRVLPFLERTLNMNCGGNKFFMGEQLMMCDIVMYCFLENPMMEFQQMFNQYPKLMAMWKRVSTHPKVSTYLQKRVKTNW